MEERQNYDLLRVLGSGAAVLLHICAKVINNYQVSSESSVYLALVISSMTRWVVPLFVIVSGAIFLGKSYRWEGWKAFCRKRVTKILPVLFFWNMFYFAVFNRGNLSLVVETFWKYSQTYYHLYYLVVALGLYALTPVLRLVKNRRALMLIMFFGSWIYVLGYYLGWWPKFDWPFVLFIPYIGYYLLGGLLEKIKLQKIYLLAVIGLATLMFGINSQTLFMYGATDGGQIAFDRLWPWVGLQAAAVFLTIKNFELKNFNRVIKLLGEVSLGVYLIHPLVTDLILRQEQYFTGSLFTFWWILSRWVMAWIISIMSVLILKKIPVIKMTVGG